LLEDAATSPAAPNPTVLCKIEAFSLLLNKSIEIILISA